MLTAAVCLLLATAARGVPDDKIDLTETSAVGDTSMISETMDMDVRLNMSVPGAADTEYKLSTNETKAYKSSVIAVDAQGSPTNVLRFYTTARKTETSSEGEKKTTSPLEGRSVRIKRTTGAPEITVSQGTISAEDRKDLESAVKKELDHWYPTHLVTIGESWKPGTSAFGVSHGMVVKSAAAKLIEVGQYGGHKCAHFQVSVEFEMSEAKTITLDFKLDGGGYFALDMRRSLHMELAGPITASGKLTTNGTDVGISGGGTAKMMMEQTWKQVGGKAAP